MIVVDTNIIASLYLENPQRDAIEALLVKDHFWIAPHLWRSELRNVLALYMRKGLVNLEQALDIMDASEEFIKEIDFEPSSLQILRLAHESGCSAYDCEFVALARELGTLLITHDRKLLAVFPKLQSHRKHFSRPDTTQYTTLPEAPKLPVS